MVLALTAALVGPYFVDWTTYRAEFERRATQVLGRQVTVNGSANARLLPFPSVTFRDVQVAGRSDAEPVMTVKEFSMDAELAPFLRGEILIFDMRMDQPHARVSIGADGTLDWAIRPHAPAQVKQVTLEKLTVNNGLITLEHATSGREHVISDIDADISAQTLAGPWRADGRMVVDGEQTELTISSGKVNDDGTMRIRMRISPERFPLLLESDGEASLVEGSAKYAGNFSITPRVGDNATPEATAGLTPVSNYRLTGLFTVDHKLLGVDEFRFETGPKDNPYFADGTAYLDFGSEPRFAVRADGQQISFDDDSGKTDRPEARSFEDRISAFRAVVTALPTPTIPGSVELKLPAIIADDTTLRDIRISAEPEEAGWQLKHLGAKLPGRTTLEASGFLQTNVDFGFSGSLLVAIAQPSGFASWLAKDVDDAIRRLRSAGFSANVNIRSEKQEFRELELVLGPSVFRGSAERLTPDDAKPSMRLALNGGALDVDGLTALASLFVSDEGANRFAAHDLDLQIKAGPVRTTGIGAETIDTALRLKDGQLDIDRLIIGGLAGATISATGTVKDFPADPGGNVDATVVAVDLGDLVRLLADRFPENRQLEELDGRIAAFPGLLGDAEIGMIASAAKNDDGSSGVAVSANGRAGGTDFTLTISGKGSVDAPENAQVDLRFSAHNENAGPVLALIGLPVLPLDVAGPADAEIVASGTAGQGLQAEFSLNGDGNSASFTGTVFAKDGQVSADGKAEIRAGDIEPYLMMAGVAMPGTGIGTPVYLASPLKLSEGVLVLPQVEGSVLSNKVNGELTMELRDGVPAFSGKLALDFVDGKFLNELALGNALEDPGDGGWPSTPFASQVASPFYADIALRTKLLALSPLSKASDATMSLIVNEDELRVEDFIAELHGGRLSGTFALKNNNGTGFLSSQFTLKSTDMQSIPVDSPLAGRATVSGSVSASGKSIEGLVASLSGSGIARLENAYIKGIDPNALPAILRAADRIGKDLDDTAMESMVPLLSNGLFYFNDINVSYTFAAGVVRTQPVRLEGRNASMQLKFRSDLSGPDTRVEGEIDFDPGPDALVGSQPQVRLMAVKSMTQSGIEFDSQPLSQFLNQRALEREQARVEALQAGLLEKQRLRREIRYQRAIEDERVRRKDEERRVRTERDRQVRQAAALKAAQARAVEAAERRRLEEMARLEAERRAAEAAERAERAVREAAEAARRLAVEEARLETERLRALAARRAAKVERERKAEEERVRAANEAERRFEEAERLVEQEARQLEQEQARREAERRAEEAERQAAVERARTRALEEARAEAVRKAEEAERLAAEEEARLRAAEEARVEAERKAEEARRLAIEEDARLRALEAAKAEADRKAEEEARLAAEEEDRRRADEEARLKRAAEELARQEIEEAERRRLETRENNRTNRPVASGLSLEERNRIADEEIAKIDAERRTGQGIIIKRPLLPLPGVGTRFLNDDRSRAPSDGFSTDR